MNSNIITLKIFKIKNCSACTIFTTKYYNKLKEKIFKENKVDQIENIMINGNKINFYKDLYKLDDQTGVPLLIIERNFKGKIIYDKYKGKWSEILQIVKWTNEFSTKKLNLQNS